MDFSSDEQIRTSLVSKYSIQTKVLNVAKEFQTLRINLLQVLNDFCKNKTINVADHLEPFIDNFFDVQVSFGRLSLVVFGANSSGKTSFIRYFLDIGAILPSDIGPVTARIVQFSYASPEQASFSIYETVEKTVVTHREDLSLFFQDPSKPDWNGIANVLQDHVIRPDSFKDDPIKSEHWANHFVEINLPSKILELGIDVYDTPGFLSEKREEFLNNNLHKLVKRIYPTLLFLYEHAAINETERSCFLAMKSALNNLERIPIFFLNTKADCESLPNDYSLDYDPINVTDDDFLKALNEKRQCCYKLLLKRREMANEVLGGLPPSFDDSNCFDICTTLFNDDSWERFTKLLNSSTFRRIIQFASQSHSAPIIRTAQDMLDAIDNYFDLIATNERRTAVQWDCLKTKALEWGEKFFLEYKNLIPILTEELNKSILDLLETQRETIVNRAVAMNSNDDPIDQLLQNKSKQVNNYMKLAIQEQVIKIAINDITKKNSDIVKDNINKHFQRKQRSRPNELLELAQRQVLSDITPRILQNFALRNTFIENILKIPLNIQRLLRCFPTIISSTAKEKYNTYVQSRLDTNDNVDDDVYKLLDAMDVYATLSNEAGRRKFANYYWTQLVERIKQKKDTFSTNLTAWINNQHQTFITNINKHYKYFVQNQSKQTLPDDMIDAFSGRIVKLECELLSAIELEKHNGIPPVINQQIGTGGFYTVHSAEWGVKKDLIVKKLIHLSDEHKQMMALEIHYHRAITRCNFEHIVPFQYVYENQLENNQNEYWLISRRYSQSLREYLIAHINEISFERCVSFALAIIKILVELHESEFIHRDLKSSNIMLDDNQQCYFIDFGTAKRGHYDTRLVTSAPIPPELLRLSQDKKDKSIAYDGAAIDIYYFGLLLFELLPKTTYEQLDSTTVSSIKNRIVSITKSDPNAKEYEDLIYACTHDDPSKRPPAENLVSKLEAVQLKIEVKLCTTCEDRERTVRFIPCGHKTLCGECWKKWKDEKHGPARCILCRTVIEKDTIDFNNATFFKMKK